MLKKTLASFLIVILLAFSLAPVPSFANTWTPDIITLIKADIVGAIDGYLQTESIGGAVAGGIKSAIFAATNKGLVGLDWPTPEIERVTLGDLHNSGLYYIYERIQFNKRTLSKGTWATLDHLILTYLWEIELYDDTIDKYVKDMDPTYEEILKRIKELSLDNDTFPVSEHFYSNLEKALAILENETDDPDLTIESSIKYLIDASAKESGDELTQKDGGLNFTKIEITYKPQKSMSDNNDIILAHIMANFTKKSYDYWKSQSSFMEDHTPNVSEITMNAIPPRIRGLEIAIDKLEATVGITPVKLDVAPFIANGRTMVPFKFVGESLGAAITWHPENRSVRYVLGETTVILYLGKNTAFINNIEVPIDENPLIVARIVNGRTMVPIKFISEALGFKVSWDPIQRKVGLMNNPYFQENSSVGEMMD